MISSVGSWLQAPAITWLVLDLTGRKHRLLLVTSAVSAALAPAFGVIVSAGTPELRTQLT